MRNINWDLVYDNKKDYKWTTTCESEILASLVKKTKADLKPSLLDVGCGTGQLSRDMYHRGFDVLGVDSSKRAIEIATDSSIFIGEGISFKVADVCTPFDDEYDLIISKYVVAFINDRSTFYKNICKSMKPTSVFVIITPQVDLLTEDKKSIGLDEKLIQNELTPHFTNIERVSENGDWWFICRNYSTP